MSVDDPEAIAALAIERAGANGSGPPEWVRDEPGAGRPKPSRELRVTRASDIEPTRVKWLWPAWIPASRLVLLSGRPGDGKSTTLTDFTARLSTASPMPDGYRPTGPINVAILSAEDSADDTIVPRLLAAGANLERVFIVGGMVDELGIERPWILPDNVPQLSTFVRDQAIRLLIVDPLTAFQSGRVDAHRDGEVRAMLLPLSNMADELECAVIANRHLRKGGAADARDAGGGSVAYTAAARLEWMIGTDPADPTRRVLAVAKSNIGKIPRSLAYRIEQDVEWETNRIRWDGSTDLVANDLTAAPKSDDERGAVDDAEDFLRSALADGPVLSKDVDRQAREAGISAGGALKRARQRLHVKSRKRSDGRWILELPIEGVHDSAEDVHGSIQSRLAPLAHHPNTHTLSCEPHSRESEQGEQDVHVSALGTVARDDLLDDVPPLTDADDRDDEREVIW